MTASGGPVERARPPAAGVARPFRFPPFQRVEISEGVELIAARSPDTPLVFLDLLSPAGARFDPSGRAGLATLTAGLLDEGTSRRSALEIAAAAERLGGFLATGTGWNVSSLSCGLLSAHLDTALELLTEVLTEATFPAAEFERLKSRTLSEIGRRSVLPSTLASRQFSRALYGDSVYGYPILGTRATVESITEEDVAGFYRDCILAPPLTVVASGDFEIEGLGRDLADLLAGQPSAAARDAGEALERPSQGTRVFIVDRPDAAQTELRVGHVGVARSDPDYVALTVLNSLLGGKFTSRLVLSLRERHGLTYSVRSSFGRRLGPAPFVVSAAVATDGVELAVREIRRELVRLREDEVPEEELAETRDYILGVFPYTVQTLEGISQRLREIAIHGLPDDHWDRYPGAVRAIDGAEILRVANEHLDPDALTIVAVGPESELTSQLEGFGTLTVWRPKEREEPL